MHSLPYKSTQSACKMKKKKVYSFHASTSYEIARLERYLSISVTQFSLPSNPVLLVGIEVNALGLTYWF